MSAPRAPSSPAGRPGAVFVLSGATAQQQGPVASLVSTAGWAGAARRVLGRAWIVTPSGIIDPEAARRRGSGSELSSATAPSWRRRIPTPAKTAAKDLRQWRRAGRFHVDPAGPWGADGVAFVWQRHELFGRAGLDLARALGVPSVLFVPATLVWESEQWHVGRPGWGGWLERTGERPSLRAADLVACGSDAVVEQVLRLGVADDRVLVTPTGVDLDLFGATNGDRDGAAAGAVALRRRLGLDERFVVGWVGSFRRFHALEQAVEAMTGLAGATLLLVGDGPERSRLEALARAAGVATVFTGTVGHEDLPAYLAAMDVALVLSPSDGAFHYSPLKLAEYLAAGRAVVAPKVGQLAERLTDGTDAVLVPPGAVSSLHRALAGLQRDPEQRERLGRGARAAAPAWSWDRQIERVVSALDALPARSEPQPS